MPIASWSLIVGVLLITMVMVGTMRRLPLTSAMIYLGVGYALGWGGFAEAV